MVRGAKLGSPPREAALLPSTPRTYGQDPALRSRGVFADVPATERLLPEGYIVASRPAVAAPGEDWWTLNLPPAGSLPPATDLRILPNSKLALLEEILSQERASDRFLVTGRVTEFQGRNYLLLADIRMLQRSPLPSPDQAADRKSSTTAGQADQALTEPTAKAVVERLLRERPPKLVPETTATHVAVPRPATRASAKIASTRPAGFDGHDAEAPPILWPEDELLIDRVGRLTLNDPWWTLVFDDQGSLVRDPPIRILPSRLLEVMIGTSDGATRHVPFLVSGQVTLHRGTNYLLLHKVLVRRDMGNLR